MANIIDGKLVSQTIKDNLKDKVSNFNNKYGREITLAVVMVGDNPASQIYVKNKIRAAEYVGIKSISLNLPNDCEQNDVENAVLSLVNDNSIDGILVQLPLPKKFNEEAVLNLIPAEKDVDGFCAENVGNLTLGKETTISCTPKGIIALLKHYNVELSGKNAVVIGRSNIVGKPIALLLLQENCTVTICHSKTKNLKEICKNADILVAAIGKSNFVTDDMVKDGAVVIDVGINRTENGLTGDVDYQTVSQKASYITPVPGGVGPMTIAMLMENAYECAIKRQLKWFSKKSITNIYH